MTSPQVLVLEEGIPEAIVYLAAGAQSRFDGDGAKSMQEIAGQPILLRLIQKSPLESDKIVITDGAWTSRDHALLPSSIYSWAAKTDCQGETIVDVLSKIPWASDVLLVSADTYLIEGAELPIPPFCMGLYDPWENISLVRVANTPRTRNCFSKLEGKLQYMIVEKVPIYLVHYDWINVNTEKDLERCKKTIRAGKFPK